MPAFVRNIYARLYETEMEMEGINDMPVSSCFAFCHLLICVPNQVTATLASHRPSAPRSLLQYTVGVLLFIGHIMNMSDELSDPKIILFIIYGFFVVVLVFCSGSRFLMCEGGRIRCVLNARSRNQEVVSSSEERRDYHER